MNYITKTINFTLIGYNNCTIWVYNGRKIEKKKKYILHLKIISKLNIFSNRNISNKKYFINEEIFVVYSLKIKFIETIS